ncbi:hypothetical protein [Neoroseomonas lacus]|nr:hypothetical protein [Neoroseomonas lacus]
MEAEHRQTGNPMAVWAAWRLCRDTGGGFGLPLPPWVIVHLDAFAAQLRDWQDNGVPADRLAEEVGNALGFKARRKNQNPITDWRNRREGGAWFAQFEDHVLGGATPTAAIKRTADDVNSTEPTVRRRLEEFAGGFGMTPFEIVQTRKRMRDEEEAALTESARRAKARLNAILRGEPDPFPPSEED